MASASHLTGYAGWDWRHFGSDDSVGGLDVDVEETGYVAGLRFEHPLSGESGEGAALRVHAGATYAHIEVEAEEGDGSIDSGHGLGWEAGAGLTFPLGERLRLTPGARYRSLSRELDVEGSTVDADLHYVAAELGVAWAF